MDERKALIRALAQGYRLSLPEYARLIRGQTKELAALAARHADRVRRKIYGNAVYIRGLIEVGNVCRNDCLYCGIRRSSRNCKRYTLSPEQILSCCAEGYRLGFRTFVLQGGERCLPLSLLCDTVSKLRADFPDCAITLSFGEYSRAEYQQLYRAGANRYLLRHETADETHYTALHPKSMSFQNRMRCLYDLKEIGYQVGCGFMVGSPGQTPETLAKDLHFIQEFQPDMCGIGPFLPQKDTPFRNCPAGSVEQTLFLLSLVRLLCPHVLLPATTALGTASETGQMQGILAGANVLMPNLSPPSVREQYALYDNKAVSGLESAQNLERLKQSVRQIGYTIVTARGDVIT